MSDPHTPLPAMGYTDQPAEKVALVNIRKLVEEAVLQVLDHLAELDEVDKRWLQIGRTQIEQGFMAVNRAVFRPERGALPDDPEAAVAAILDKLETLK